MPRRLTGFTPSGELHLGNHIGAIRPIVAGQNDTDTVVFVSDLHALTVDHDPDEVRRRTLEFATVLLAAGADPERCLFFVQSHVPEVLELHYLLERATGYGEAHRMIQFKEKSRRQEQVRMSLLTYPVLMAADILLHDTRRCRSARTSGSTSSWRGTSRAGGGAGPQARGGEGAGGEGGDRLAGGVSRPEVPAGSPEPRQIRPRRTSATTATIVHTMQSTRPTGSSGVA